MTLKFFYNGIKASDGKLQKASYSKGGYVSGDQNAITIYGKDYSRFCAEIRAAFTVQNDTDSQTDYFCNDSIRVNSDHPLYAEVAKAEQQQTDKRAKIYAANRARKAA